MERNFYDENQPQGSLSVSNLRNTLRALAQMDLFPLRPRASRIIEPFEYGSNSALQANWSGTGVTVTTSTTKQEGNNAMQCVIDATDSRSVKRTVALNLSLFAKLTLWERVNVASSVFRFYLKDSSGHISYWNLTSNGTLSTWQQDTLTLATPSSNNGTNAILTAIVEIGFDGLDASKTYIFDTIKVLCGLSVWVEGGTIADFYQHVYLGEKRIDFAVGSSPVITPPSANPRIDLLVLNSTTLEWVVGAEASSPVEPTFPSGKIPICLVYQLVGEVKIVDYEDKDGNPTAGYIYKDVRPFLTLGSSPEILSGLDASKPTTYIINRFYWATNTNKLYFDNGSAWVDITALFLAYTPENVANKSTDVALGTSDTKYPSQKAVKTYVDNQVGGSYKVINITRDITAASGNVAYTGVGFTPKLLTVHWYVLDNQYDSSIGNGSDDKTTRGTTWSGTVENASAIGHSTSKFIYMNLYERTQSAIVKTFDADGFTLTWTMTGSSGTGTAYCTITVYK